LTESRRKKTPTVADRSPLPAWSGLVGTASLITRWQELVQTSQLPPVLLLDGRAGLGKRALLAALAALHVCESANACGICEPCLWLLAGRHPEVLWIQPAPGQSLLLQQAAELQEHLALSPGPGARFRIAVVVDCDRFSVQAANRLLKTLEEPPLRARIFLSTSSPGRLLDTVLSRCVRWRVAPPTPAESLDLLERRYRAAGRAAPPMAALQELLKRAGLAPGLALRLAGFVDEGDQRPAGAGGAAEEAVPGLSELQEACTAAEVLRAAEIVSREAGLPLASILEEWEIAQNRSYWQVLATATTSPGSQAPGSIARRRHLLRQAKQLVLGARISLNAQLTAEALGLQGTGL